MPKSKIPSPARSQGFTPRRHRTRRTLSVASPALSTTSGRLTAVIDQFKEQIMDSFAVSPVNSRRSVLMDNTDIEEPMRRSWWKRLNDNSRDVKEVFDDNEAVDGNKPIEEWIDIEVLSQEKKNYTLDLPEISDSESIHSIVLPQKKIFNQKENQPQHKFGDIISRRSSNKSQKTNSISSDQSIQAETKELFQCTRRTKPVFPAALLQISPNETTAEKAKELAAGPKPPVRNLFGNHPATKRNNMYAQFVLSESEDEIPEIQPKVFEFPKRADQQQVSSRSSRVPSLTSNVTTDIEMDDWKHLPSSTMVENQIEDAMCAETPAKRARLSKLSEAKESEAGTNSTNKTIQSNKSGKPSLTKEMEVASENITSTSKTKPSNKSNKSKSSPNKEKTSDTNQLDLIPEDEIDNKARKAGADNPVDDEDSNDTPSSDDFHLYYETGDKSKMIAAGHQTKNMTVIQGYVPDDANKNNEGSSENYMLVNEMKTVNNEVQNVDTGKEKTHVNQSIKNQEELINQEEHNKDVQDLQVIDENADKNDTEYKGSLEQNEMGNEEQDEYKDAANKSIEKGDEVPENENDVENEEADKSVSHEIQVTENKCDGEEDDEKIENEQQIMSNECEVSDNKQEQNDNDDVESKSDEELNQNVDESDEEVEQEDESEQVDKSEEEDENVQEVENEQEDESEQEDEIEQGDGNETVHESHDQEGEEQKINNETTNESQQMESEQELDSDDDNAVASDVDDQDDVEDIETDEGNEQDADENQIDDEQSHEEIDGTPNSSPTTNKEKDQTDKSPEVILHNKTNQEVSFTAQGRNTSVRRSKSMYKSMNMRPSIAPPRESVSMSDGTKNSSAENSGWDSHRTTRKTLRQTFGKDFTLRKSLRALVMEKSARQRQTDHIDLHETAKVPQANSTELPDESIQPVEVEETVEESDHEVSIRTRQMTLDTYLQKIKQQNLEKKQKIDQAVRNSLKRPQAYNYDILNLFKVPAHPPPRRPKPANSKPKKPTRNLIPLDDLPEEVIEDMKYKPPKRFQPANAPWITKRLYNFLETTLEPKYDYKARVRAEKLVQMIYYFAKDLRRHNVAPIDTTNKLKQELARLDIVKTHYDFYEFFHEYMPREVRIKVVPDMVNQIPVPREGVFSNIL